MVDDAPRVKSTTREKTEEPHSLAALNLDAGTIAPNHHADFTTIDLAIPALAGYARANLLDMIISGEGAIFTRGTA